MKLGLTQFLVIYVVIGALTAFAIGPVYWMVASSLRPAHLLFATPPDFLLLEISWGSYIEVFRSTNYPRMMFNSAVISVATTAVTVVFSAMAAHSLARLRFRGKILISRGILVTYVFPQILLVVPLFVALVNLGLADTHVGLVITYLTFSFPFAMWILTAYFQTIPAELEESALISGAMRWQVFWHIVLPLAKPGLAAAGIFTFFHAWNEFLYALVLLNSERKATLAIGLVRLMGAETLDWGALMAATTMMVVPVLLAFLFYQRNLVGGLTAGATKG